MTQLTVVWQTLRLEGRRLRILLVSELFWGYAPGSGLVELATLFGGLALLLLALFGRFCGADNKAQLCVTVFLVSWRVGR